MNCGPRSHMSWVHVWIFTHHPYLQTERVKNSIGERIVKRVYFEKLYSKLWTYQRLPGVPIRASARPRSRCESRVSEES
jgi:hypothetical protein